MKEKMMELRNQGLTHKQIAEKCGLSKAMVGYYLTDGRKERIRKNQQKRRSKMHPYACKLRTFLENRINNGYESKIWTDIEKVYYNKLYNFNGQNMNTKITVEKLVEKFSDNPKCYLTGRKIDIHSPRSYNFDHIIPKAKGGDNSIENLGICIRDANQAKNDMLLPDFIQLCKDVLENNGYKVTEDRIELS